MKQKHINDLRAFNIFYTGVIGLLDRHILNSKFSLPEARILFELYHNENITASDIVSYLNIDKGYLSRILKQFEKKGLIIKVRSGHDKRSTPIKLTQLGKTEFDVLNKASNDQINNILKLLSNDECDKLIENINSIKTILNKIKT